MGLSILNRGISFLRNTSKKVSKPEYLPNGQIKFSSEEQALEYAKKRVVEALNTKNPYEKGIVIKDNIVICEKNGTNDNVTIALPRGSFSNAKFIHGHPVPTTLSLDDILIMFTLKLKQMTAFNKNGEFSTFKSDKCIFVDWEDAGKICSEYAKIHSSFAPKELQSWVEGGVHGGICDINPLYADVHKIMQAQNPLNIQQNYEYQKKLYTSIFDGSFPKAIHKWLQSTAQKFGFKYETNYSNLK